MYFVVLSVPLSTEACRWDDYQKYCAGALLDWWTSEGILGVTEEVSDSGLGGMDRSSHSRKEVCRRKAVAQIQDNYHFAAKEEQ